MASPRDTHRAGEEIVKSPSALVGEELVSFRVTLSGAAPHAITFAAQGLPDMANTEYKIMVHGQTASRVAVQNNSIATTGFTILNGAAAEIVHVFIQGKIAGRLQ